MTQHSRHHNRMFTCELFVQTAAAFSANKQKLGEKVSFMRLMSACLKI